MQASIEEISQLITDIRNFLDKNSKISQIDVEPFLCRFKKIEPLPNNYRANHQDPIKNQLIFVHNRLRNMSNSKVKDRERKICDSRSQASRRSTQRRKNDEQVTDMIRYRNSGRGLRKPGPPGHYI